MTQHIQSIWEVLVHAGVVKGTAPERNNPESPWFLKILTAFSAWFAALLLIFFIALAFESLLNDESTLLFLGLIMTGSAFAMLRIAGNDFKEHLALAISLTGQACILFAIVQSSNNVEKNIWLQLAMMQGVLAVIMPHFVHRIFSTMVATMAVYIYLDILKNPGFLNGFVLIFAALCWLNEFYDSRHMEKVRAVGYGLVLAFLLIQMMGLFDFFELEIKMAHDKPGFLVGEFSAGMAALYSIWRILERYKLKMLENIAIAALMGILFFAASAIGLSGLSAGVTLIVLGFSASNRILLGLGLTSLLLFITSYYYLLDTSLLHKSVSLAGIGAILLLLRWLLPHIVSSLKEIHHA